MHWLLFLFIKISGNVSVIPSKRIPFCIKKKNWFSVRLGESVSVYAISWCRLMTDYWYSSLKKRKELKTQGFAQSARCKWGQARHGTKGREGRLWEGWQVGCSGFTERVYWRVKCWWCCFGQSESGGVLFRIKSACQWSRHRSFQRSVVAGECGDTAE